MQCNIGKELIFSSSMDAKELIFSSSMDVKELNLLLSTYSCSVLLHGTVYIYCFLLPYGFVDSMGWFSGKKTTVPSQLPMIFLHAHQALYDRFLMKRQLQFCDFYQ